jgi:hypothetical protein
MYGGKKREVRMVTYPGGDKKNITTCKEPKNSREI